jgi:hypothetical protein
MHESSDFDHEINNEFGTPAILGRALVLVV